MKRLPHHRIAMRTLVLGLLCLGVALASTGCQTTVEEYTPPVPVDPHRAERDRDSILDVSSSAL
jgi:hypothetical protein